MTKTQSIFLGTTAFLAVLSAWQFMQIRELQDSNQALVQQVKPVPGDKAPVTPAVGRSAPTGAAEAADAKETAPIPAPSPEDAERVAREARFREMRQIDRTQRQDARVLNLTTRLKLSPEQQSRLRELLQSASAERDTLREAGEARRQAGTPETDEERRANMAKFANIDLKQEEKLVGLLSAEQGVDYVNYKSEQKAQSDENWANQRLRELQDRFSLTEEQKEAAFQYFAKQEQEQGFDLSQVMAAGEDPMDRVRKMDKERLEALKGILTPEQFTLHSAQEAQRAEMFRTMQSGGAGGGPGPRPNP